MQLEQFFLGLENEVLVLVSDGVDLVVQSILKGLQGVPITRQRSVETIAAIGSFLVRKQVKNV